MQMHCDRNSSAFLTVALTLASLQPFLTALELILDRSDPAGEITYPFYLPYSSEYVEEVQRSRTISQPDQCIMVRTGY